MECYPCRDPPSEFSDNERLESNMKKLMALNRGEIAIRILRAANELGLRTVAVHSWEDRLSLHCFKADETYQIGAGKGPVEAYMDIDPKKIGRTRRGKPVIAPANLPAWWARYQNPAVLAAVGARGARQLIRERLTGMGLQEGKDWWGVA